MSNTHRLERKLPPDWDAVKATWDECLQHLKANGLDDDTAYSLCMVAQELLENAVKYGRMDGNENIILSMDVADRAVTIEVKSRTRAEPAQLKKLDDNIQWIRGFQNPFEAYVERLKEVSAQPYTEGESGLGLARVAYEGQCILDFYIDETDTLAISAVHPRTRTSISAPS